MLIAFLDANVLAKPFTRSLVWVPAALSDYKVAWSRYVETEAQKHLSDRATPLAVLRERHDLTLAPDGRGGSEFTSTDAKDRQVLADAAAAGASFLVTENVTDFGLADLSTAGIVAVHPDLFIAYRVSREGYAAALDGLSSSMTNPARTPAVVHAATNRRHPLTYAAFSDLHDVRPDPVAADYPTLLYRGDRCVRCLSPLDDAEGLRGGLDSACRAAIAVEDHRRRQAIADALSAEADELGFTWALGGGAPSWAGRRRTIRTPPRLPTWSGHRSHLPLDHGRHEWMRGRPPSARRRSRRCRPGWPTRSRRSSRARTGGARWRSRPSSARGRSPTAC